MSDIFDVMEEDNLKQESPIIEAVLENCTTKLMDLKEVISRSNDREVKKIYESLRQNTIQFRKYLVEKDFKNMSKYTICPQALGVEQEYCMHPTSEDCMECWRKVCEGDISNVRYI